MREAPCPLVSLVKKKKKAARWRQWEIKAVPFAPALCDAESTTWTFMTGLSDCLGYFKERVRDRLALKVVEGSRVCRSKTVIMRL